VVDDPFIVLHSAALEMLDDEEMRALIAHEMGHVISGHALYRTIAEILLLVSFSALPILAGIALLPIRLALLEWMRKSELSSDRAGLLGSQDPLASQRLFMKMSGGVRPPNVVGQLNLDAFMAQAQEYSQSNEGLDVIYKILNTLALTHPMHTVRAGELQQWMATGEYDRILRGEYTKRGPETASRPLRDDFAEAGSHYARETRETLDHVVDAAKKAANRVGDAFRKAQEK